MFAKKNPELFRTMNQLIESAIDPYVEKVKQILKNKISNLEKILRTNLNEKNELRDRYLHLMNKKDQSERIAKYQDLLEELESKNQKLSSKNQELHQKLSQQSMNAEASRALTVLQTKYNNLQKKLEIVEIENGELEEKLKTLQQKLMNLQLLDSPKKQTFEDVKTSPIGEKGGGSGEQNSLQKETEKIKIDLEKHYLNSLKKFENYIEGLRLQIKYLEADNERYEAQIRKQKTRFINEKLEMEKIQLKFENELNLAKTQIQVYKQFEIEAKKLEEEKGLFLKKSEKFEAQNSELRSKLHWSRNEMLKLKEQLGYEIEDLRHELELEKSKKDVERIEKRFFIKLELKEKRLNDLETENELLMEEVKHFKRKCTRMQEVVKLQKKEEDIGD